MPCRPNPINTLRPGQNGRHFSDAIFKGIFLDENGWIPIKFSLKFVPKGPIHNTPALVQMMAWRRPGAKPFSEPMVVSLLTHICVTRPQWVRNLTDVMSLLLWTVDLFGTRWKKILAEWLAIIQSFFFLLLSLSKHFSINGDFIVEVTECSIDGKLLCLTHWGQDKMAVIFQKIFSNAFSWMKMCEFRLIFHWILFLMVQLTKSALVQIMACRLVGAKPWSEPMMA